MGSSRRPGVTAGGANRAAALAWLREVAYENLATELGLAGGAPALVVRRGPGVAGVAVLGPDGQGCFEASGAEAAASLIEAAAAAAWPLAKVRTSGTLKEWLRPRLVEAGYRVVREHDQLAMVCRDAVSPERPVAGRWATPADGAALVAYQDAYNIERRTDVRPDWATLLAAGPGRVGVREVDGLIACVARRTADTAHYATVGGFWTEPSQRGRGLASGLAAFITAAALVDRPAVHLIVDDDNHGAVALYRGVGFRQVGSTYTGYLHRAAG